MKEREKTWYRLKKCSTERELDRIGLKEKYPHVKRLITVLAILNSMCS